MKITKRLKSFCAVLLSTLMLCTTAVNAAQLVYTVPGLEDADQAKYIEDSIVYRVDNNQGYINNKREVLKEGFTDVRPYLSGDVVYVPIEFLLKGLDIEYSKTDTSVTFEYNDKEYTLQEGDKLVSDSDTLVQRLKTMIYVAAEDVAAFFDLLMYNDKDIVILSKTNELIKSIPDKVMTELRDRMAYEWDWVKLAADGYVTGMITHPNNPELIYCRTDVGGMYKWNHEAQKWIQLSNFVMPDIKYLGPVAGIALDPNNDQIIFAACGSYSYTSPSYLMKSEDQGTTWKSVLDVHFGGNEMVKFGAECVYVDPNNSNYVYCGSELEGFWQSEDGGETWKRNETIPLSPSGTAQGCTGSPVVYVDPTSEIVNGHSSDVYVAVWNDGLYKSSDGGKRFERMEGSQKYTYKVERLAGRLFVSFGSRIDSTEGGFYEYKDGEWIDLTPKHTTRGMSGFTMDPNDPNFIVLSTEPYTVGTAFRSYDGGQTWENMGRVDPYGNRSVILHDPMNSDRLLFTGGFFSTTVENKHADVWEGVKFSNGVEELCTNKLLSIPSLEAPRLLAGFMDKGYKVVTRLDTEYEMQKPSYAEGIGFDFCEEDPHYVVAVGEMDSSVKALGKVVLSSNYGKDGTFVNSEAWKATNKPVDCAISATVQDNGYPVLIVPVASDGDDDACLRRSKDWGQTWETIPDFTVHQIASFNYGQEIIESDRVDGNTFYFSDDGNFYVSTDGGDTWGLRASFSKPQQNYFVAAPGVEGCVWYKSADNAIMITNDKGATWSRCQTITNVVSFGFGKGKQGSDLPAAYAVGDVDGVFGIYLSDDMGKTWKRINDARNHLIAAQVMIVGDRNYYGRFFAACNGFGGMYGQPIGFDDHEPIITIDSKGTSDVKGADYAVNDDVFNVKGSIDERGEVRVNGEPVEVDSSLCFDVDVKLENIGENTIYIEAVDEHGNKSETKFIKVRYLPDYIGVDYDMEDFIGSKTGDVQFKGRMSDNARLIVDGRVIPVNDDNTFDTTVKFDYGEREIEVYAQSRDGKITSEVKKFTVRVDNEAPTITLEEIPAVVEENYYILNGSINETARLRINGSEVAVRAGNKFSKYIKLNEGVNTVELQALDVSGNVSKPETHIVNAKLPAPVDTSQLEAERIMSDFKMDGDLSEWGELPHKAENVTVGNPNNVVRFDVKWDEDNLYVAAEVLDDVLKGGFSALHLNDGIEIYIDGDYHHNGKYNLYDKQFILPVATEDYDKSMYEWKATDNGFTFEAKIPWSAVKMPQAYAGQIIGFDLSNPDNDGTYSSDKDGTMAFNDKYNNAWSNTSVFATLTLK